MEGNDAAVPESVLAARPKTIVTEGEPDRDQGHTRPRGEKADPNQLTGRQPPPQSDGDPAQAHEQEHVKSIVPARPPAPRTLFRMVIARRLACVLLIHRVPRQRCLG